MRKDQPLPVEAVIDSSRYNTQESPPISDCIWSIVAHHFALFLHMVTIEMYCAGSLSSELRILQVSDAREHLVI